MIAQWISIVGAGLSGLTLGRILQRRGIPAVLYERTTSPAQHGYGITLHASTYKPLLEALDVDENSFKSRVAVNKAVHSSEKVHPQGVVSSHRNLPSFRANRGKLEAWLREGLDIRWGHALQHVNTPSQQTKRSLREVTTLNFENGHEVHCDIVVGADGVHSWLRKLLLPGSLSILPYVVFNGKRKIERLEFEEKIQPHLNGSTFINFQQRDVRLNFSINDYISDKVSVSWTYSRPSRGPSDSLHRPDRALSDASDIPNELFTELASFQKSGLPKALADLFTADLLRKDRVLHWLMRIVNIPNVDTHLRGLAEVGIVLMGDATHAEPIVGGNGANQAITDALHLAEVLESAANNGLQHWVEGNSSRWTESVKNSINNIHALHTETLRRE